ncbi:IclR family transcriptional regulator [Halomicrobium salinisoli]|uniref:IclR family transcriptional regulator n=1 Tax=Halomicrobium salinisoli TaxID=2878391 RepID=UPI001CF04589|nr:IclR family transcriptional regulator [Halomicrobium salinisoli]
MAVNAADDGGKRVEAVQRSFAVLDVLRESGTVRIDDVAEALDMPTSTAHVHLKTLESVGYVVRTEDGYRRGLRFLRDGVAVRDRWDVYRVAKPALDDLADETGEVANLGVEENGRRVILSQSEGSEAVYDNAPIGEFTDMHWTALGKAILAERSTDYVDEYVSVRGLPSATENTITDPDAFREELQTVRDRGYALEDEERRAGIRSVAVPVTVDGDVVGAISLSGPRERYDDDRIVNDLLPALRDAANVVEVKYAYE